MNKETKILAVFFVVLALGAGSLRAEIIEINITAEISEIYDDYGLLNGQLGVGSIISGSYIYDSDTPDSSPAPDYGAYYHYSPPYGITLSAGGFTFQTDPANVEFYVGIENGYIGIEDIYAIRSYNNLPLYNNVSVGTIDWQLDDSTGTALSSTALPTTPPVLEDWDFDWGIQIVGGIPEHGKGFFIRAFVTYVELVPYQPKTYYVEAVNGDDNNNGLSPQTAFATIQKAIDSAFDGDTVIVADGTYTGSGNRDIDFLGKAITVRSENGPNNCIIDCNGTETEPHRGFNLHSGEDSNSVLQGFTIKNGYASGTDPQDCGGGIYCYISSPTITNCIISGNSAEDDGGGIYCSHSSPTITNCTINGNSTKWGGGGGIHCEESGPTITDCIISRNSAYSGGGIYCYDSHPKITNCKITGNIAESGGGIFCSRSSPTITNCTISNNSTGHQGMGGGIYCEQSSPTIINCTISENSVEKFGVGGGIYCSGGSSPKIINCIITRNEGGISCWYRDSNLTIINCTISKNSHEGINFWSKGRLMIRNSILWGNTRGIVYYGASVSVTNTDIQGGWEGEGNIDTDPLLTLDGHLQAGSPCIDAGDPNANFTSQIDIDGEPRIMGACVDMGADEFLDTDTDALPDWWESKYFDSATAAEPNDDSDFDGYTNLTEYNIYSSNPTVAAKTCYVDANQPDDSRDGLSWDTAKRTIQAAIDTTTNSGDRVIIAPGIYTGLGDYDLNPRGKIIVIQSTDPNNPELVASTIIDPNREGDGFYFDSTETDLCTVSGLTITNGRYGILCELSNPTITNCTLEGNGWGAIFCYESSPRINNCIITGNAAVGYCYGLCCINTGVIHCEENSNPIITNCTIAENRGGIYCRYDSSPIINNCIIRDTLMGFYCRDGGSPMITNSIISGNGCGGIYCSWASLILSNCLIGGNGFLRGGGIGCGYSSLMITNCTVVDNLGGGGIYCYKSSSTIANCILWGNTDSGVEDESAQIRGGTPIINYSCVQGWTGALGGIGNIGADPCFVEPGYWDVNYMPDDNIWDYFWVEGDYHLLRTSPCIDAGTDAGVYADIEGNIRPFDFPGVDNNGELPDFDMGAYEAMVSCFGVNHVKLGTKAGKKGNKVEVKGTFDPASPIDFAVDDVTYTIDDGLGYMLTFVIPAGSFEPEGKPDKQKFRFHSAKGSQPGIKARFDFLKCKFELKVKGVMDTSETTADTLAIVLQAGANLVEEVVQVQAKPKHLEFEREPKLNCLPEM